MMYGPSCRRGLGIAIRDPRAQVRTSTSRRAARSWRRRGQLLGAAGERAVDSLELVGRHRARVPGQGHLRHVRLGLQLLPFGQRLAFETSSRVAHAAETERTSPRAICRAICPASRAVSRTTNICALSHCRVSAIQIAAARQRSVR